MEIFTNVVFFTIISALMLVFTFLAFYCGVAIIVEIVKAVDDLIIKIKNKHKKLNKNERINKTL